jgi:hypothetical protein
VAHWDGNRALSEPLDERMPHKAMHAAVNAE